MGQTMKKILGILLVVLLTIGMLLPAAGVSATPVKTINVKQSTLGQQSSCTNGVELWHFVITQVQNVASAPASITVKWNGTVTHTVNLGKFTGGVAHYTVTTSDFPDVEGLVVTDAYTDIYSSWDGEFNLSHVDCSGGDGELFCISGYKINDATGEGLLGWTIKLYNAAGALIATTTTDATGFYSFCQLEPGNYTVKEEMKEGWNPVSPDSVPVTLVASDVTDIDFRNTVVSQTTTPQTEVGGTIYPVSKGWMIAPVIALIIAVLTGTVIIIKRHQA
jgi:hypothetical protein